jgi:hypothetical protein
MNTFMVPVYTYNTWIDLCQGKLEIKESSENINFSNKTEAIWLEA